MKKVLLLAALGLGALVPIPAQAMSFNVFFDISLSKAPNPVPPFVGQGFFSFDQTLGDGSYLFKDLTNVALSFAFLADPPIYTSDIFVYNFYGNPTYPTYSNADPLYDPNNLKVEIYGNGTKFYFNGPSSTQYGNLGSLTLVLKKAYLDQYFPNELKPPSYLSFQPNNPSGGSPTQPYNNYGAYVTCADANPHCTSTDPQQVYNGTYGTIAPGPLPLMAAAATFGWSRKLRRRLQRLTLQQPRQSL